MHVGARVVVHDVPERLGVHELDSPRLDVSDARRIPVPGCHAIGDRDIRAAHTERARTNAMREELAGVLVRSVRILSRHDAQKRDRENRECRSHIAEHVPPMRIDESDLPAGRLSGERVRVHSIHCYHAPSCL